MIPAITNRVNYIHILEDLLTLSSPPLSSSGRDTPPPPPLTADGLDIGTGANLIYPLLGAAIVGWTFVGVDITDTAIAWATRNRDNNPHLGDKIVLRQVTPGPFVSHASWRTDWPKDKNHHHHHHHHHHHREKVVGISTDNHTEKGGILTTGAVRAGERYAFCMCNPPFFETEDQCCANPRTNFQGTPAEMVCPGGEGSFVRRLVYDSLHLQHQIHWFSTLVGKKATLRSIRTELHRQGVPVVRTAELAQGKTSRWVLAWSFTAPKEVQYLPLRKTEHHPRHTCDDDPVRNHRNPVLTKTNSLVNDSR